MRKKMGLKKIDKFFELIDSNGQGERWQMVQISNVRSYFEECFGIIPPQFPCISADQQRTRILSDDNEEPEMTETLLEIVNMGDSQQMSAEAKGMAQELDETVEKAA